MTDLDGDRVCDGETLTRTLPACEAVCEELGDCVRDGVGLRDGVSLALAVDDALGRSHC